MKISTKHLGVFGAARLAACKPVWSGFSDGLKWRLAYRDAAGRERWLANEHGDVLQFRDPAAAVGFRDQCLTRLNRRIVASRVVAA